MIILPAISGLIGLLSSLIEPVVIGAGIGALFSGGASLVGGGVEAYRDDGHISGDDATEVIENAVHDAAEGALFGGVFGAFTPVLAPVFNAIDDVLRAITSAFDDAFRWLGQGIKSTAKNVSTGFGSLVNRAKSAWNAQFFRQLPKTTGRQGYVYIARDTGQSGVYKIGRTNHPVRRLPELQAKSTGKLQYNCIIQTADMYALEYQLHADFAAQRLPNTGAGTERFKLDGRQLSRACGR